MSGSLACTGGALTPDRDCPNGSTCTSGYCAPPPQQQFGSAIGRNCVFNNRPSEALCNTFAGDASCQPFLNPANPGGPVKWTCDTNVGSGTLGTACSQGNSCATGFCGSNGTCFQACDNDVDCFVPGASFQCQDVKIVVEGRTLQSKSCIPG